MNIFGEYLRKLRKSRGLSQRDLADKIGVSYTYISKIENSTLKPPSNKTIGKMAEALDADAEDLLFNARKIPDDIFDILEKDFRIISVLRDIPKDKLSQAIDDYLKKKSI